MDLTYYRRLILETARLDAFRRALRTTVRPGDRVLDVGAGLGTYAFFAAEAGAGHVWAIDGDPVIHVAADLARANGLQDTVTCLRGWIPDVGPAEPVDVVVFEDFNAQLLDARTWRLFRDLQARFATSTTRWLPARARLHVAVVDVPDVVRLPDAEAHGIGWEVVAGYAANLPQHLWVGSEVVLASARLLEIQFDRPVETWPMSASAQLTCGRSGAVTALAVWHELELMEGLVLDNAPGSPRASWGHLLLPLADPVDVHAGDPLRVDLTWGAAPDGAPGWLSWTCTGARGTVRGDEFAGFAATRADLLAGSLDSRPAPSARSRFVQEVLTLTDGQRSVAQIADELASRYPELEPADLTRRVLVSLRTAGVSAAAGETT